MINKLNIKNLYKLISGTKTDDNVGIKVSHLSGDDYFSFYIADIAPGKEVKSHYHHKGNEIYMIVEGQGEMRISNPQNKKWLELRSVRKGDSFSIPENTVHQLINNSYNKNLLVIFGCPSTHLDTDRTFIEISRGDKA